MLVEPELLIHWLAHFYGYGTFEAPVWFVSHEENGGDLPEEVSEKLSYFSDQHRSATQPTLCDIREMYKRVAFTTMHDYRFGSNAAQDTIFGNLISFAHGFRNKKLPGVLTYQKNAFVSSVTPNEALIRLYPLPAPHSHSWYYSWLELPSPFGFLKTRDQYQRQVYPDRIGNILNKISAHKPEVVVMYGMSNINSLKRSVQDFFPAAKFKTVQSTKLQIPQHHCADLNGTRLIITTQIPALRHNRIETGFDWFEFGKSVRSV